MRSARLATLFALLAVGVLPAALRAAEPATAATDPWAGWRFLAGDWMGEVNTSKITGTSSFRFELDDHVLVRRNHADMPGKHNDLMVISPGANGKKEAIYFDNEGHVLRYTAELSADGKTLTFLTAPAPSAPRFRLTYNKLGDDTLDIRFEIARPGTPESFSPYLSGHARRAGALPPK